MPQLTNNGNVIDGGFGHAFTRLTKRDQKLLGLKVLVIAQHFMQ
jgi:hypothetical protein